MKTVKLIGRRDDDFGGLGLIVKGMTSDAIVNPAKDGLTIAHDLIEHVNGVEHIGTIDDELEALGAIWFTRGQYGDMRRDGKGSMYTPEQNIAADVSRMFRDFFYGSYVDVNMPRTQSCIADDAFKAIIEYAMEEARSELNGYEDAEAFRARLQQYIRICLPRMRIGYRKAQRKYKTGIVANTLFWTIENAVDHAAKRVEFEGQEYKLRYGWDRLGNAFAECLEQGEDY